MSKEKSALQKTADGVVEAHRSAAAQTATTSIGEIFDALVVNAHNDVAKLPEEIFKGHFLPFFSGEKDIKERKEFFSEWIGIAGSPMAEVNIIDNNGQTLFTVPPMLDSSVIETAKRNLGESFSDIYSQYKMHSNNLPVVGERVLADAFEKKIGTTIKKSDVVQANQDRWNSILNRYGREKTAATTNVANSRANNAGDELDYD